jgi:hypothetical protein
MPPVQVESHHIGRGERAHRQGRVEQFTADGIAKPHNHKDWISKE